MEATAQPTPRIDGLRSLFGLFSFLLALALILHQLWWDGFDARHGSVILAAAWVLLGPTSVGRLMLLLVVQVYAVAGDLPNIGDHILLVTVVGFFLLLQTAWMTARGRALPTAAELFNAAAPMLRAAAVVLYAAAVLAKLNTSFLDPVISCAREELSRIPLIDPGALGLWSVELTIVATISIELALAILLAVPRTRILGLALGGSFHVILVLAGNVPFAAVMLALYVSFLPETAPVAARQTLRRWLGPRVALSGAMPGWVQALALSGMVVLWQLGGALAGARPDPAAVLLEIAPRLVVLALISAAFALWIGSGPKLVADPERSVGALGRLSPILGLAIVLLAFNAASPYLGLKTQTSFNMFSNLRTEAGRWNHVLLPETVRAFDYQDDLVEVTGSNDGVLFRNAERGEQVTRFELERYLRRHPGTYATDVGREGIPRLMVADGEGSTLQQLVDKVARFQPVPAPDAGC